MGEFINYFKALIGSPVVLNEFKDQYIHWHLTVRIASLSDADPRSSPKYSISSIQDVSSKTKPKDAQSARRPA